MRKIIIAIALMLYSVLGFSQTGIMTDGERRFVINYLEETEKILLDQMSPISDNIWNYKNGDSWSARECFEHILLSELGLYSRIQNEVLTNQPEIDKYEGSVMRDGLIITWVTDRVKKVKTIKPLEPTNRWPDRQTMVTEFKKSREKIISYLKTTEDPLRIHFAQTPIGEADAYQMFLIIGGHGYRHTKQMEEAVAVAMAAK